LLDFEQGRLGNSFERIRNIKALNLTAHAIFDGCFNEKNIDFLFAQPGKHQLDIGLAERHGDFNRLIAQFKEMC
jgi:hypothetical protein